MVCSWSVVSHLLRVTDPLQTVKPTLQVQACGSPPKAFTPTAGTAWGLSRDDGLKNQEEMSVAVHDPVLKNQLLDQRNGVGGPSSLQRLWVRSGYRLCANASGGLQSSWFLSSRPGNKGVTRCRIKCGAFEEKAVVSNFL